MNPKNLLCRFLTMITLSALLLHIVPSPCALAQQELSQPATTAWPNWLKFDDITTSGQTDMGGEPPEEKAALQVAAMDDAPLSSGVYENHCYLPVILSSTSNYSCDVVLSPKSVFYDDTSTPSGSVVCLQAGTYDKVVFRNLQGTAENPIIITNHGGQVRVTDSKLVLRNCQHVRLTGTGTSGVEYGIHAERTYVNIYDGVRDIEIDHIQVSDQRLRVNEPYDPAHEMTDIHIHDNYLHASPGGFGWTLMYIGHAHYDQHPGDYVARRVEIDHNLFDGADGQALKIASVVEGCSVHHNRINDVVRVPSGELQSTAINIGHGCDARVYNNVINGSGGYGIMGSDAFFGSLIYNNLLVDTGQCAGAYEDAFITWGHGYRVFNNTIIGAKRFGIAFRAGEYDNVAYNNIVLDTGSDPILWVSSPDANFHHNHTKEHGYTSLNYGFVNPTSGDYHLTKTSNGPDAGADSGLVSDLDDTPRPLGNRYDIGCYELNPNEFPPRP